MQEYKIRIPDPEVSRQVQEKAFELGYAWPSGDKVIRHTERPILVIDNHWGIYSLDNQVSEYIRKPEISYQDFLRIGEEQEEDQLQPVLTTLNTNTEIMSELTLKCSKEPKNAKNLTVGNEYVGILIDAEGDQVDSIKDAKFFMCTNNSGNEARYSISLFQEIVAQRPAPQRRVVTPPPPPPPPVVVIAPFEDFINNTDNVVNVNLSDNGIAINVDIYVPKEDVEPRMASFNNTMQFYYSEISCGVGWVNGLNTFVPILKTKLDQFNRDYYNGEITELLIDQAIAAILKKVLQTVCQDMTKSFLILSTNDNVPKAVAAMDSLVGHTDIFGININSDNNIHVWVFKNRNVE